MESSYSSVFSIFYSEIEKMITNYIAWIQNIHSGNMRSLEYSPLWKRSASGYHQPVYGYMIVRSLEYAVDCAVEDESSLSASRLLLRS